MAKQIINIGTSANDGTGDKIRNAFAKVNSNFTELYDGAGSQTLNQVLIEGNTTGGEDISISNGDKILLDNGANLKKGTTDAGLGGSKGIALRCAVDYELKWEAGRLYVMGGDGFTIREVSHNFTTTPIVTDDETKGFVVDSRWILDNGDLYVCTDATTGAAVWVLQVEGETLATLGALISTAGDATPNDSDYVATSLTAGGLLKKITWTNVKAFLKTYYDTIYQVILTESVFGTFLNSLTSKNTLIDADLVSSVDTADSNKAKKTTWLNVWTNYIKPKVDSAILSASNWTLTGNDIWNSNSGNVGIGTGVAARTKFEIKASTGVFFQFLNTSTRAFLQCLNDTTNSIPLDINAEEILLKAQAQDALKLSVTSANFYKLPIVEIPNSTEAFLLELNNTSATANQKSTITIKGAGYTTALIKSRLYGLAAGGTFEVFTRNTSGVVDEVMIIDADGQLKITKTPTTGTTSDKLLVRDTSGNVKQIDYPATMTNVAGGLVPTPPNNTTTFLRGDGTFAAPAGGGGSSQVKLSSQTLTAGSWTLVGSYYEYTFSNANIVSTGFVTFTPNNASINEVSTCRMLPQIDAATGTCKFYSLFPPQTNIVGEIVIFIL